MAQRTPKRTPPNEIFARIKEEIEKCMISVTRHGISRRMGKNRGHMYGFLKKHKEFEPEADRLIRNRRQEIALAREAAASAAMRHTGVENECASKPADVLKKIFETMRKEGTMDYAGTSRAMGRDMNFVSRFAHENPEMREAIDRMIEKRKPDAEKERDARYVEGALMTLIPNSRDVPTWRYLCRESGISRDRRFRIEASEHMQSMLEKCRERIAKMPASTFFGSVKRWYVEIFNTVGNKENSKSQGEAEKNFRKEFDAGIREAAVERFKGELVGAALEGNVEPDSPAAASHLGILRSLVLKFLGENEGALEEIRGRVAQARAPAQESPHIARRVDAWRGTLSVTGLGDKERLDSWNKGMRAKRQFERPKPKPPENGFDVAGFWEKMRSRIEASPEIGYARSALHLLGASRTNPAIELGSRICSLDGEAVPSLNVAQVAAGSIGKDVVASMRTIGEATLSAGSFGCAVSIMGYDVLDKSGQEFLFECANAALEKGGKFAVVSDWPVRMEFGAFGFEPTSIGMFNDAVIAVFEKTKQVRVRREPEIEGMEATEKLRIMRMCGRSFNPHSREDVLQRARAAKKNQAALAQ